MEVKQKVNVKVLELTGVNETATINKQDSSSRRSTFRVSIPNFKTCQNIARQKNSFKEVETKGQNVVKEESTYT